MLIVILLYMTMKEQLYKLATWCKLNLTTSKLLESLTIQFRENLKFSLLITHMWYCMWAIIAVSSKHGTCCQNHLTKAEFGDVSRSAAAHILSWDARLQKAMRAQILFNALKKYCMWGAIIRRNTIRGARKYYATERDHLVAKVQRVTQRWLSFTKCDICLEDMYWQEANRKLLRKLWKITSKKILTHQVVSVCCPQRVP